MGQSHIIYSNMLSCQYLNYLLSHSPSTSGRCINQNSISGCGLYLPILDRAQWCVGRKDETFKLHGYNISTFELLGVVESVWYHDACVIDHVAGW